MTDTRSGRFRQAWEGERLSTGIKMLLILSAVLLPMGLVAAYASIQSARENSERRAQETQARVELKAQRINSALSRSALTIRAASAAMSRLPIDRAACELTLARLSRAQSIPGNYALFAGGSAPRCATAGFIPPPELLNSGGARSRVEIAPDGETLRFALFDEAGAIEGVGEFSRSDLSSLSYLPGTTPNFDLVLNQGERRMLLREGYEAQRFDRTIRARAPAADGRVTLEMAVAAPPITFSEALLVVLPLLMWLWATGAAWFIVNRALLKPLARMQRAVASYQPGDAGFDMPSSSSPAREIGELGGAFDRATRTIARHEADLEAAVERQSRLVREVHHRVKNNLQVVASLINLHARGNPNPDVQAAYASIQRRVDALAVVHRNHFAELEENRGVSLRSLIAELGSNLRASAPPSAANMVIRVDIEPYYCNQDVAVSVAFLVTEIVEYAMFCGGGAVAISLEGESADRARLSIQSDSLRAGTPCEEKLTERFDRIVTGLSRQLRSTIDRDGEEGRYSLALSVLGKAER